MKAALIPPVKELQYFGRGDFHLLLSHLLSDFPKYRLWYQAQRELGAYLVLDNSAHEFQAGESAEVLARQAIDLNAQEVVVPDHLFDCEGTIQGALQAMEVWVEGETFKDLNPHLMYVPQGKTEGDWVECLNNLYSIQRYMSRKKFIRPSFCIGLSKDYEMWPGGLSHLIDRYLDPLRTRAREDGMKVSVHMLGWGRDLWALSNITKKHKWIRSTDSAKPFVYALKNIRLDPNDPEAPKYPTRPKNYFNRKFTDLQRDCAIWNANIFRLVAKS